MNPQDPTAKLDALAAECRQRLAGGKPGDLSRKAAFRLRMVKGRADKLCSEAYSTNAEREAAWEKWQAKAFAGGSPADDAAQAKSHQPKGKSAPARSRLRAWITGEGWQGPFPAAKK